MGIPVGRAAAGHRPASSRRDPLPAGTWLLPPGSEDLLAAGLGRAVLLQNRANSENQLPILGLTACNARGAAESRWGKATFPDSSMLARGLPAGGKPTRPGMRMEQEDVQGEGSEREVGRPPDIKKGNLPRGRARTPFLRSLPQRLRPQSLESLWGRPGLQL